MLGRSEEHTSELQSLRHLVCRLLLEKKAVLFQKELSREEDKMKDFEGKDFVDLRKYFLEIMVDQFKEMDNEKQKKILEEMVKKLNSLSPEELNEFKNKMNISDITDESVKKILLGGGIYSMFAGAVGIIGFPAYIFLTSFIGGISSIIGITLGPVKDRKSVV